MQLSFDQKGPVALIRFDGEELGADVSDEVRASLLEELSRRDWAAIDLSRVSFVDSSGLGVLVAAIKELRERGGIRFFSVDPRVEDLFNLTGLTRFLQTEPDEASALAALESEIEAKKAA